MRHPTGDIKYPVEREVRREFWVEEQTRERMSPLCQWQTQKTSKELNSKCPLSQMEFIGGLAQAILLVWRKTSKSDWNGSWGEFDNKEVKKVFTPYEGKKSREIVNNKTSNWGNK